MQFIFDSGLVYWSYQQSMNHWLNVSMLDSSNSPGVAQWWGLKHKQWGTIEFPTYTNVKMLSALTRIEKVSDSEAQKDVSLEIKGSKHFR